MAILRILLIIIFLIAAVIMTVVVLMQEGKSAGLGTIGGGGSSDSFWDKNKKNTLEGKFERWTKLVAGIFMLSAFILMFLPNSQVTTQSTTPNTEVTGGTTNEIVMGDDATTEDAATTEEAPTTEEAAPSESPAQ